MLFWALLTVTAGLLRAVPTHALEMQGLAKPFSTKVFCWGRNPGQCHCVDPELCSWQLAVENFLFFRGCLVKCLKVTDTIFWKVVGCRWLLIYLLYGRFAGGFWKLWNSRTENLHIPKSEITWVMRDIMVSLAWCCSVIDSYVGVTPVHLSLPQSCFLKSSVSVNEIKCMPVPLWKRMES